MALKIIRIKKIQILLKSALVLSASLLLFSCVPETETPLIQEDPNLVEALNTPTSGEKNLRKDFPRNYFEKFDNEIGFAIGENGNYFPSTGSGNSSHMGKALTFINQLEGGGGTVAAPVTMCSGAALIELGITDISNEVSSITTDGKGNLVWFTSTSNIFTSDEDPTIRLDFVAQLAIVGGTGKFEGATGGGEVTGFFNSLNGQGSSTIKGRITY
ncbi:MAG: hypothetical protein ACI9UV_001591 [Algoriphagus sp.]|jgi:hypothetical protein